MNNKLKKLKKYIKIIKNRYKEKGFAKLKADNQKN